MTKKDKIQKGSFLMRNDFVLDRIYFNGNSEIIRTILKQDNNSKATIYNTIVKKLTSSVIPAIKNLIL